MNILISNDDGIDSIGLRHLLDAIKDKAKIFVAAPAGQQSAASHRITMRDDIAAWRVEYEGAEDALVFDGTPADCVKLGYATYERCGIEIDAVFSGVNLGANLGTDTIYSGTVAAAVEGNICGVPAAAFSVESPNPKNFDYVKMLAGEIADGVIKKIDSSTTLNVNVPDFPFDEIKGVRVTRLGVRDYDNWIEDGETDSEFSFRYSGKPIVYNSQNTEIDVIASQQKYATITPLSPDMTNFKLIDIMKGWKLER